MTENTEGKQHATLGASSCDRWWNCPGSVRLSRDLPSTRSEYAAEGSAAHDLAEACLRDGFGPEDYIGRIIGGFEVTEEMAVAVQVYVDFCRAMMTGEHWIEQRVSLEKMKPPAPMFGTSDFVALTADTALGRVLDIVDYKHGAGYAVDAIGNPQMRYYGLATALTFSHLRFDKVRMTIVQPRAWHTDGPVRSEVIDVVDLLEWGMVLVDQAKGTLLPDAKLAIGKWCKFCPASAICPAVKEQSLAECRAVFKPVTGEIILPDSPDGLSLEEISRILDHADGIQDWLNAVRAYAHAQAERGIPVPGYKLAPKRATRKWKDDDQALLGLEMLGLAKNDLFTEPKLKSPAQVEKVLGAKRKGEIAELVTSESTGTNLVREETARPAVPHAAARVFKPIEGEAQ